MRMTRLFARTTVVLLIGSALAVAGSASPALAASCSRTDVSDFNGDGISDVAIGEVGQNRFHVIYGHGSKLNATTPQDQLIDGPRTDLSYADTLVEGDFNNDGCADLAVQFEKPGQNGSFGPGGVSIFLGSKSGLKSAGILLAPTAAPGFGSEFGKAMAVGDLNGDGRDDLVVGSSDENSIYVFLGTSSGVSTTGHKYTQGVGGIPGDTDPLDFFGTAVAVGDFTGDNHADVAIGAPNDDSASGRVIVLRGGTTAAPLSTSNVQVWSQNSAGVPGVAESSDNFGASLAVGNFKGNGRFDLAVGAPGEGLGSTNGAGIVDVLFSAGSSGLTGSGAQEFSLSTSGVPGTAAINESFGATLVSADFNGDSKDDLAVGQPDATVGSPDDNSAGAVTVLYGTSAGLTVSGAQRFTQDTAGIAGVAESNDNFGWSLAAVRVTHSAEYDLVVGVPGEQLGSFFETGMMELIPGSTNGGLTATGSEAWTDGTSGVKGSECTLCNFGSGVA